MKVVVEIFRLLWATTVSAITAAAIYAIQLFILSVLDEIFGSGSNGVAAYVGIVGFCVAVPAFFLGLILVGLPTWFVARRLRRTSYRLATFIGAVQASIAGAILVFLAEGLSGLVLAIGLPVAGSVGGAMFLMLMTDDAKRPPAPPSEPPTP